MYYYAHPYQNPLFVRTIYRSDLNPTCAPEAEAELSKNGSYPLVLAEISPDKGDAILLPGFYFRLPSAAPIAATVRSMILAKVLSAPLAGCSGRSHRLLRFLQVASEGINSTRWSEPAGNRTFLLN